MNKTPSDDFYYALVAFLMQTKQHIVTVAVEHGLTGVQALTLLSLKSRDERSMTELCKQYDCDASNVTGIVDGLEQKGLVSRQPHPHDRRIKLIHLEEAGRTVQKKLIADIAGTSPDMFNGLADAEIEQLAALIQKMNP
ncbi:MarR family transcriptional regulator [Aeromicrobium sp.]|nr:MarR family transcriptional regulator [Candidatus Saccharibacteria bacterium]